MKRPAGRSPLLAARGGVSWVTLALVLALAVGAYLAWVWVPVYVLHYEVVQVVQDYMNQAVKNREDADLVEKMCHKIRTLAQVDQIGDDGRVEHVPAVALFPQDVNWVRDVEHKRLTVSFDYERAIAYPWIGQTVQKTFEVEKEGDLEIPDWGPQR